MMETTFTKSDGHRVDDAARLGALIRDTRRALGMTQEALSMQTGISRPTIRAIERGKPTAHLGLVLQICRDLGIALRAMPPEGGE
ncbi:helix-turn-helix domain-containing protein [Roseobacter sp. HKCCA0434]|uniref:helix-turn-helix domain-containing protein n=1 Tax=Roseobacter sp. HKCCA0434 TaxID=3079297 RepID=UPI0029058410|nr:helix-turn-helix domain-containing protein [Roseobacter sp. HKCCA0434]